jgi:hypothetical protein
VIKRNGTISPQNTPPSLHPLSSPSLSPEKKKKKIKRKPMVGG